MAQCIYLVRTDTPHRRFVTVCPVEKLEPIAAMPFSDTVKYSSVTWGKYRQSRGNNVSSAPYRYHPMARSINAVLNANGKGWCWNTIDAHWLALRGCVHDQHGHSRQELVESRHLSAVQFAHPSSTLVVMGVCPAWVREMVKVDWG